MPATHDRAREEEADAAAWAAAKGAGYGALKYGAAMAVLGGIGYAISPIYRGLTIQFKVYLQMSGMVIGSMIEADYHLRQFEQRVRIQKRLARERARWESFEKEIGKRDDE